MDASPKISICEARNNTIQQVYIFTDLKKKRLGICAEFGIRWGVLKQFLYRAACYVRTALL